MNEVYAFMQWLREKTSKIQNNMVMYNKKYYFIDRRKATEFVGGFEDLFNIYKNE